MFANALQATAAKEPEVISLEMFSDMLSESVIIFKLDIGNALVFKAKHPISGDIVLINTSGDQNAVIYM
jgi:hypothetical protein